MCLVALSNQGWKVALIYSRYIFEILCSRLSQVYISKFHWISAFPYMLHVWNIYLHLIIHGMIKCSSKHSSPMVRNHRLSRKIYRPEPIPKPIQQLSTATRGVYDEGPNPRTVGFLAVLGIYVRWREGQEGGKNRADPQERNTRNFCILRKSQPVIFV